MRYPRVSSGLKWLVAASCLTTVLCLTPNADKGIPWMYKGLAVWAFAWAGLDAFGIGANDVANSFANSVASKTITYSQACLIACIAEFVGCIALGKNVTDTIKGKIVDVNRFESDPYMLMLGMSMVSMGSAIWVLVATYWNMPVSTTHATVGAVMGVGIAAFGPDGVKWNYDDGGFGGIVASWFISPAISAVIGAIIYLTIKYLVLSQPDDVSFRRGLWTLPIYAFITFGIIAAFMIFKGIPIADKFSTQYEASIPTSFGVAAGFALLTSLTVVPWVRRFIADNENLPWWTILHIMCVPVGKYGYYEEGTHDIQRKGTSPNEAPKEELVSKTQNEDMALRQMAGMQVPPSLPGYSQQSPMQPPMLFHPASQSSGLGMPQQPYPTMFGPGYINGQQFGQPTFGIGQPFPVSVSPPVHIVGRNFGVDDVLPSGVKQIEDQDRPRIAGIPMYYTTNDKWYDTILRKVTPGFYIDLDALCDECSELHSHAVHFFDKTERLYKVLQVATCSFSSVSHGANDIANSIGPLSAVWAIYTTGLLNSKSPVETWILAYGGAWLDLGLLLFGHQIMMVLGNKVTYQTPSRGFSMELSSMLTVLVFSKLGVPVSTTHCISGATMGVGLCNGREGYKAVNWRMIIIILGGWIITCPSAGVVTGLIFWGLGTTPHPAPGNGYWQQPVSVSGK